MILRLEVDIIHEELIARFGGARGIRDINALESAINRPFQTFDGKPLYPSVFDKAAALVESILINHPFVDGNKRTGYTLLRMLLLKNGSDIHASEDEKYRFIIDIAAGNTKFEDIVS